MTPSNPENNPEPEQTNQAQASQDSADNDKHTTHGFSVQDKKKRFEQWAFEFKREETKTAAKIRSLCRILIIMAREFEITAISLRASALTYSTMLSLVPILAMSTAILKGYGSDNDLKIAAYKLIDKIDPHQEASAPGETTGGDNSISLPDHLRNGVETIFTYVDRTNFATLGAFGIIGLIYAVILVMGTIESAMNAIWHSDRGRSLSRKIMDYMSLVILLPVSLNVALAGDAILASPTMFARLNTIIPSVWALKMMFKLLPFLFIVLSLMIMYRFFPNVRVKNYAALSGALFASTFWFLVQRLYLFVQIGVARQNAIYGSFATVPLFLIWMHMGWMFILLGASLAHAVQNRNRYCLPGTTNSPQRNLQLAFDILETVYHDFENRKTTGLEKLLAAHPREQPGSLQLVLNTLISGKLLHRLENGDSSFVPAVPAELLAAREVVRLFFGREEVPTTGGRFAEQVMEAAEKAIAKSAFPSRTAHAEDEAIRLEYRP